MDENIFCKFFCVNYLLWSLDLSFVFCFCQDNKNSQTWWLNFSWNCVCQMPIIEWFELCLVCVLHNYNPKNSCFFGIFWNLFLSIQFETPLFSVILLHKMNIFIDWNFQSILISCKLVFAWHKYLKCGNNEVAGVHHCAYFASISENTLVSCELVQLST